MCRMYSIVRCATVRPRVGFRVFIRGYQVVGCAILCGGKLRVVRVRHVRVRHPSRGVN